MVHGMLWCHQVCKVAPPCVTSQQGCSLDVSLSVNLSQHVMMYNFSFIFTFLFITCTFTVGHMTDNLPFLTWLTWSHTLFSHVTHCPVTHVNLGWLIVTHWCFTLVVSSVSVSSFVSWLTWEHPLFLLPIVLVTFIVLCDVYCSCDAIVHIYYKVEPSK